MVKPVLNQTPGFSRPPEKDNYNPARHPLIPRSFLFWRAGRFLLYVFAAIEVLSTPLEQMESEIVVLFLKRNMERTLIVIVACVALFSSVITFAHAEDAEYNCHRIFTGGPGTSKPSNFDYDLPHSWSLDISGQKYDTLFDGYITNVTACTDKHSIAFDAQPNGGSLIVRLPKALIDSTRGNQDVPFTVIINGQASGNTTETTVPSSGDRMVCIPLSASNSSSRVEVIGTSIAPEFGFTLSSFVMAIAVTGVVIGTSIAVRSRV